MKFQLSVLFGAGLGAINSPVDRETAIRIQLLEWQIGIANSTGIARNILTQSDNLDSLKPRQADHNLVRFKLLMGMMVWSHQTLGIKYHTHLAGRHGSLTDDELLAGLSFNPLITSNSENEAYAEYTMELYHGYGCHCMPDHAHYIFTGGSGRPQDALDINCQLLRSCYSCEEEKDSLCDTHGADYSYNLNRGTTVDDSITCTDPSGSCAQKVCECDKSFAINAATLYTHSIWDDHHHGLDFNRAEQCKIKRRGEGPHGITHCDRKFTQTSAIDDVLNKEHDDDNDHDHHDVLDGHLGFNPDLIGHGHN